MKKETYTIGKEGEKQALQYLENHGMKIMETNFRSRFGEVDIVGFHRGYLVFVEVKLRKSDRFASAMEFVDYHKQNRLRITAEFYLAQNPTDLQPRFDVIEIYAPEGIDTKKPVIHHLEDAFQ